MLAVESPNHIWSKMDFPPRFPYKKITSHSVVDKEGRRSSKEILAYAEGTKGCHTWYGRQIRTTTKSLRPYHDTAITRIPNLDLCTTSPFQRL